MIKKVISDFIVHNKYLIISITIILITIFSLLFSGFSKNNVDNDIKPIEVQKVESQLKEEQIKYVYIDIKGAVTAPSVYKLEEGSRIIDAIKKAGGLKKEADTSLLNLSKKVQDEMAIIIYTKKEVNDFKKHLLYPNIDETIKYIESNCECPDPVINQACTCNNINENSQQNTKVSINTADKTLLQTLPGIGESKALNIIEYRNTNGSFTTIDDIKNVSGIGDSIFAKIKDYITI